MLAVKVDYESKLATVGTEAGIPVRTDEILTAIKSLGYQAELYEPSP